MKGNVDKDIDMANTKSLIIIKPMSIQLQKLHEVLMSVATEENIEIVATDNLGELAQLYSMGGQHLTLVSDPKICALFLQENRTYNLAKHSKTLLFTPQILPIKILDKFVKLGLTENLLDTSPPKTLLFKVKLLLKSIKSNDKYEDKSEKQEQVVKSMLDLGQTVSNEKAAIIHTEENNAADKKGSLAEELKKKKIELELENGLDYLKDLKKKKGYQEDSIQTNWSSKAKNLNEGITFDETSPEDSQKKTKNGSEDLDAYFRSKETKHVNLDLVDSVEEIKTKKTQFDENNNAEIKVKEKKTLVEIELTESKEKATKPIATIEEEAYSKVKSLAGVEIEIEIDKNKTKDKQVQFDGNNEDAPTKARKAQMEIELETSKKEKLKNTDSEDSAGKMSGKLKSLAGTEIDLAESEIKTKEKKEYEKTLEEERVKKIGLELEFEKRKKEKKEVIDSYGEDSPDRKQKKSNETEITLTDDVQAKKDNQNGMEEELSDQDKKKRSTNTDIEFAKETKKRDDNEESNESDDSEKRKRAKNTEIEIEESETKKKEKVANEETRGEFNRKNIAQTDGAISSAEDKKEKNEAAEKEIEKKRRLTLNEIELINTKEKDEKAKAINQERDENQKARSKGITELDIDPSKKRYDGNNVENIDTYMRSGEAKKDAQDWSQKKKNEDVTLKLSSTSQKEIEVKRDARRDQGEVVIDYRMLKEEFGALAKSGYKTDTVDEKTNTKAHDAEDEEGSFKVVELKANGFDFAVNIINQYYSQDIKAPIIYKTIAQKLLNEEKGYCVFYTFLNISNEHKESFSSFKEFQLAPVEYWEAFKKEETNLAYLYSKTMSTWLCREIKEKDSFWSDNELPAWAPQELTNKVVEYIYPFYDGLDRMGMAYLYFPDGIRPQSEKKILVLLELLRGVFLETIQRNSASSEDVATESAEVKKGNVLSMFGNLFGKKKTG